MMPERSFASFAIVKVDADGLDRIDLISAVKSESRKCVDFRTNIRLVTKRCSGLAISLSWLPHTRPQFTV
jgi:hypothetical protein